jgi:hypothetical protein
VEYFLQAKYRAARKANKMIIIGTTGGVIFWQEFSQKTQDLTSAKYMASTSMLTSRLV